MNNEVTLSRRTSLRWALAAAIAPIALATQAQEDDWAKKPIQLLVGFPAGGLHDVAARAFAASLSKSLHVPVVVVPTPGAGGAIALQKLAAAAPDGYTLMYTPSPALLARPHQMSLRISYRDFTPITTVGVAYPTVSVKRASAFSTFKDLADAAKAQPNKLSYGTSGIGGLPHLAMEQISSQLGLKLLHVPFQGTMPAIMAAMSDQIDVVIGDLPHAGIRPLAVISDERLPSMPGVPSMRDIGVSEPLIARFMFIGPKGLPSHIVKSLDAGCQVGLQDAAVQKYFSENQIFAHYRSPPDTAAWWVEDEKQYRALIDRLGLVEK